MAKATPVSIKDAFAKLKYLSNRTPETIRETAKEAFATLSEYRDGGVFIAHYAGNSEWERHPNGDELVFVVEGETMLILLFGDQEVANMVREGEFLVVPKNTWHRFETPKGVKVMAVTPQPSDHSVAWPKGI